MSINKRFMVTERLHTKDRWNKIFVMQQELGRGKKQVKQKEKSTTFHFVHSDEISDNRLSASVRREWRGEELGRNKERKQKCMKCDRRGVKEKEGIRGRDTGRHEQASKCQGEMNSWRRDLHQEVWVCELNEGCVCLHIFTCICTLLHALHLAVYNKHARGLGRTSFAKISICHFN